VTKEAVHLMVIRKQDIGRGQGQDTFQREHVIAADLMTSRKQEEAGIEIPSKDMSQWFTSSS
jgi:hypothetical protein